MAPRTPEQFENIREERKQEILNTALQLFAQKGYDNTSISQISREADISKGLIYNYFESKQQLLKEVVWNAVAKMPSFFNSRTKIEEGPLFMLDQFIGDLKRTAKRDKTFWKLYIEMGFHLMRNPDMMEELEKSFEFLLANLKELFYRLNFENPELEMRKFGALIDGIFLHHIYYDNYPIDEVLDSIHSDMLRNIKP